MNALEEAERRFEDLLKTLEKEIAQAGKKRADAARSLEIIERIEQRTDTAIGQLRDIIRQGESSSHG